MLLKQDVSVDNTPTSGMKVDNDGTTTFGKITGSSVTGSIAVNTGGTLLLSGAGITSPIARP